MIACTVKWDWRSDLNLVWDDSYVQKGDSFPVKHLDLGMHSYSLNRIFHLSLITQDEQEKANANSNVKIWNKRYGNHCKLRETVDRNLIFHATLCAECQLRMNCESINVVSFDRQGLIYSIVQGFSISVKCPIGCTASWSSWWNPISEAEETQNRVHLGPCRRRLGAGYTTYLK